MAKTVIGIIGGSGLYDIDGLKNKRWEKVESPFGQPSDDLLIGELDGQTLVFLPRHGRGHRIPPSEINLHQYVLIPIIKSVGGCSYPIISNIEMIQDPESKIIDCTITIEVAGHCRRLFHINRGILVRKPPTGYVINVEFLFIYNNTIL